MELDPLLLSRLQFAWVIAWHILLPAFTVGLASYIAFLEALYFITRREIYSAKVFDRKGSKFACLRARPERPAKRKPVVPSAS